jgi:hypothetical protein
MGHHQRARAPCSHEWLDQTMVLRCQKRPPPPTSLTTGERRPRKVAGDQGIDCRLGRRARGPCPSQQLAAGHCAPARTLRCCLERMQRWEHPWRGQGLRARWVTASSTPLVVPRLQHLFCELSPLEALAMERQRPLLLPFRAGAVETPQEHERSWRSQSQNQRSMLSIDDCAAGVDSRYEHLEWLILKVL